MSVYDDARRDAADRLDRSVPYGVTRAVGRCRADGPAGYASILGGPVRPSRVEALADYIAAVTP